MRHINFSQQWDKLKPEKFVEGATLTTFRAYFPWMAKSFEELRTSKKKATVTLNKHPIGQVSVEHVSYLWSDKVSSDFIKKDTYHYWTWHDWKQLLEKMYGIYPVFGIMVTMRIATVDVEDLIQQKIIV